MHISLSTIGSLERNLQYMYYYLCIDILYWCIDMHYQCIDQHWWHHHCIIVRMTGCIYRLTVGEHVWWKEQFAKTKGEITTDLKEALKLWYRTNGTVATVRARDPRLCMPSIVTLMKNSQYHVCYILILVNSYNIYCIQFHFLKLVVCAYALLVMFNNYFMCVTVWRQAIDLVCMYACICM